MASTKSIASLTAHTQNGAARTLHGHPLPVHWRDQIVPDPHRPGEDRVRLARYGIAVWAIVGHLNALGDNVTAETISQAAEDFRIPASAITTALAYYHEHRAAIDVRLAINAAAVA